MEIEMIFFLLACAEDVKDSGMSEEDSQLWEEISGYQDWNQLDNWQGIFPSQSVHGSSVQTWYNQIAFDALVNEEASMPENAIVVKEGYLDETGNDINTITVMKKIAAYNPDAGDWYWASFAVDGSVNTSGTVDFCISCHAASQRDYLLIEP